MGPLPRFPLTTLAALGFVAFGAISAGVHVWTDALDDWTANIATESWAIAVVILVVDRIVAQHERGQASERVRQVLTRVRAGFYTMADFAL